MQKCSCRIGKFFHHNKFVKLLVVLSYTYTYSIEIIACTNLFTVPGWNLLPATGTEGDTVAVCATLFGLPANGLECDFVLQLIISEETIPNTGTHLLFYRCIIIILRVGDTSLCVLICSLTRVYIVYVI